jgi:hypothetical protein
MREWRVLAGITNRRDVPRGTIGDVQHFTIGETREIAIVQHMCLTRAARRADAGHNTAAMTINAALIS